MKKMDKELKYDNGAWTDNGFCRDCAVKDGCLRECRWAECYRRGYEDAIAKAVKWAGRNLSDYCDECEYEDFMTAFEDAMKGKGATDDAK